MFMPLHHGRTRLARICQAFTLMIAVYLATWSGSRPATFLAIPSQGKLHESNRREAAHAVLLLLAPGSAALLGSESAHSEMVPPLERAVQQYKNQILEGVDFLFFEVKSMVEKKDTPNLRYALASAATGASTSPLERDLSYPLSVLISENDDAEEMGWKAASIKIDKQIALLKTNVGDTEWKLAIKNLEKIRYNTEIILKGVNELAEKEIFPPLDESYMKREFAFKQAKRDKVSTRNALGTAFGR